MANGKVISLDAYIDDEIRTLAKIAYNARKRLNTAKAYNAHAMRAFTKACDRLHLDPAKITIGEFSGETFYLGDKRKRGKHGKR
jgi:hypothetical protein